MSPQRRRRRFATIIQSLETRCLLAAPPIVDSPDFAQASDIYTISATPLTGNPGTVPAGTPVDAIAGSVKSVAPTGGGPPTAEFGEFVVDMPSGASSIPLFTWANTAVHGTFVITAKTEAGQVRTTWTLTAAIIHQFSQTVDDDGNGKDHITIAVRAMAIDYYRYAANGTLLDHSEVHYDANTNSGTGTGTAAYDGGYLATTPNVVETMEFGAGQIPIGNTKFAVEQQGIDPTGGIGASMAAHLGVDFSFVDGRESLPMFGHAWSSAHLQNAVYTRRNPSTGQPTQRHRVGNLVVRTYSFSDSSLDNQPRLGTVHLDVTADQLANYTYSGPNNQTQAATVSGWNYITNQTISNLAINSGNVALSLNESRNTPLDTVTFRFLSPVTLTLAMFQFDGGLTSAGLTLTAADGNQTWTLGNLAAQQAADGKFKVKLFADRITSLDTTAYTSALFVGSSGKSWTLDRSAPTLVDASFDYNGPSPTSAYDFAFALSEPVSAAAVDGTVPILIRRIDTGALVTTATGQVGSDPTILDATFSNTLADNRYRATVPAGSVRDAAGNLLASDLDLPFFVLAGDINHDAKVDFADLVILAQNYNASGRSFSQGNLNYSSDGKVDFADLVILAQQYNKTLPAALTLSDGNTKRKIDRVTAGYLLA
jgi:hypothetical protein